MPHQDLFLGIDLGTSGCRAIAIDGAGQVVAEAQVSYNLKKQDSGVTAEQSPADWTRALEEAISLIIDFISNNKCWDTHQFRGLAVDGTSGSVLFIDARGVPVSPALMYNDNRARDQAKQILKVAPPTSAAHGTASGLAKILWLEAQGFGKNAAWVCHQADWALIQLGARPGISDYNSCLKTGYDAEFTTWPEWLSSLLDNKKMLPEVVPPGTPIGVLEPSLSQRWGLPEELILVAGTTDSTAAVLATGAHQTGTGITSLGSTLVVKILAEHPVSAPRYGVYSQPYGSLWLVGGGSNTGGAVLRHYFTDSQIVALSREIDTRLSSGLDYYPLLTPGERFPINDPHLPARVQPVPTERSRFLHGLLEGVAEIERLGYQRLQELGCPPLNSVYSVGGGAINKTWEAIRHGKLGVPMRSPKHLQAAYGTALLARNGWRQHSRKGPTT